MNRRTSSTYGAQTVGDLLYPDSQLKELTDAGGTVIYAYNKDGQLATISDPATRKLTDPATKEPAVVQLHWDTDQTGGYPTACSPKSKERPDRHGDGKDRQPADALHLRWQRPCQDD